MPKRPLYLFAKPQSDALVPILALPRTSRERDAGLLHITLLPFVDLADVPPQFLPTLIKLLDRFEANAFRVVFDSIVERNGVTLRGSEPMRGAKAFQTSLTDHLKAHDFPFFGTPPNPHITINYRPDGGGAEGIDPISWTVTTVLLVESVFGQTRHAEHGRWSLREKS